MDDYIGDRIRQRRTELGMNQPQLGKRIGRSKGAISQWESGKAKPDRDSLIVLAKGLQCSQEWLLEGKEGIQESREPYQLESNVGPAPVMSGSVPVISWVQAGSFTEVCHVELDPEDTIWLPRPPGASDDCFALRVVGDSMVPRYNPGTLIYVDPEVQPENGDDVVARLSDSSIEEATFKRLIMEPGAPKTLMALNPNWPHRFIDINGNCEIIGTVIADMNLRRR
ncbi:LexA family protein [Halomonas elongata]|uniref:LexA family protein n=1 Tax=Halomonas elongata TaxID=2746 RepID=UPI001CEC3FA1|nr:S24 family peptidase [Halomonas elongata]